MTKRFDLFYHIGEGFKAIFSHGVMSFATVCMIVACLLIMGSFSLVAINVDNMLGELERDNEFLAYVDDTLTDEQARGLEQTLKALPNVAEVTFVSREEALADYVAKQGENELFQDLPSTVLRHRYRIHIMDIEQMETTVQLVDRVNGVAEISAALEIAKGFVTVRNVATAIAGILVVILLIISLFIISNTIRLATFYRREEIAIMKMCGATNWFVRWPFIFQGLLLGLFGSLLAFGLQWGVYALVEKAVVETEAASLLEIMPFELVALPILGVFGLSGLIIGVLGSIIAIHKFLQV